MKHNRSIAHNRLSLDSTELAHLCILLAEVGAIAEKRLITEKILSLIEKLLEEQSEETLTSCLNRLVDHYPEAHDLLADLIESTAESLYLTHLGQEFSALIINVPILAWSRFSIGTGKISDENLLVLKELLKQKIVSDGCLIALANHCYSPDQLPRSFVETRTLAHTLAEAALSGIHHHVDTTALPTTNHFLADSRHILGAIVFPNGTFPFQRGSTPLWNKEETLSDWSRSLSACMETVMIGCSFKPLLPDAYHTACRNTDIASRPYSLQASISFLQQALGKQSNDFCVSIGRFYDRQLEELRIGFSLTGETNVVHGVIWPLLGTESDDSPLIPDIEKILRESGVTEIIEHDINFALEFCDDCGTPLYPNRLGDAVHAEMPETDINSPHSLLLH